MRNHLEGLNYYGKQYRIAVIAPAGMHPDPTILGQVQQIATTIPNLHLSIPPDMIDTSIVPYHANSDEERFKHLKTALESNDIDAIWCWRGGYGTTRLLQQLSQIPTPAKPKLLIGYSDITALHLFLQKSWGWASIHGAGLGETSRVTERDGMNFQYIIDFLARTHTGIITTDLIPLNAPAKQMTQCTGKLTGGNLALCETSISTIWEMECAGKILMLEDVHEDGYALDRSFCHLKESGMLDDAVAIVLGTFTSGDNNAEFALQRFADEINIPVFRSQAFGHSYYNIPFLEGVQGVISVKDGHFVLAQPDYLEALVNYPLLQAQLPNPEIFP